MELEEKIGNLVAQSKQVKLEISDLEDALLKREGEFGDLNMPGLDTIIKMLMASEIFAGGDLTDADLFGGFQGDVSAYNASVPTSV